MINCRQVVSLFSSALIFDSKSVTRPTAVVFLLDLFIFDGVRNFGLDLELVGVVTGEMIEFLRLEVLEDIELFEEKSLCS